MKRIIFLLVSSLILFPVSAFAYLDPGTGSYVLQILLAVILGLLFTFKNFWQKIKFFFKKLLYKENKPL